MRRSTDRSVITPVMDWLVAPSRPGSVPTPAGLEGLDWLPARVPGTVAGALRDAGKWSDGDSRDFDADDWWFRSRLSSEGAVEGEETVLRLGGVATLAEVFLDGELVLTSESMFAAHEVELGPRLRSGAEIAIRCRALGPIVSAPRLPRARWRPRLAAGGLRHQRTMLLGRAPGIAGSPAVVGPWRGVSVDAHRDVVVDDLRVRAGVSGREGHLAITSGIRGLGGVRVSSVVAEVAGISGTQAVRLQLAPGGRGIRATGDLVLPNVEYWWPHTHGTPTLYDVRLLVTTAAGLVVVEAGRVGFRELASGPLNHDVTIDGLDLSCNGVPVFARGAVWTPIDLAGMAPDRAALRTILVRVRDAGMNMLRIAGTGAYESSVFHDLCDELGVLVWQDFMFANFDYPGSDSAFRTVVEAEAREVLADLGSRPSLAVLCGNSEVEQQAVMLGVAPDEARGELFGEVLPRLVREAEVAASYVPSAPCGGDLPFHPGRGIANYYGVGGYRRSLSDVRIAGVRFAAECLALANVPDGGGLSDIGAPRDAGADWDFGEIRDHYLALLYGIDVAALRRADPERFLELSRSASGELMAEVFGEWRRAGSACGGGLVHWLTDLKPGAGWGVLDHHGAPKVAYHHLRRALAPVAVWLTDEGLGGLDVHVANDRNEALHARLRVSFYRDGETLVDEARAVLDVDAHGCERHGVEELLGRFVDASYAYRFGPPGFDVVIATLEHESGTATELISQAVRFPAGRPTSTEVAERLGLRASRRWDGEHLMVTVHTKRFAHGVRLHVPGFEPCDDAFPVEPGGSRTVRLGPASERVPTDIVGQVSALNLVGRIQIESEPT